MSFHNIRFPASLSFGSIGGPERRTEVVALVNGFEERNTPWAHYYSVDYETGTVSFVNAPDIDLQVTAGFEFDVPVRFDTDRIQTSVASFQAGDVPSVPIIEVRV